MPGKIWVEPDQVEAAGLDTTSLNLAVEEGTVVAVRPREGTEMPANMKVGTHVFFKSYGADTVEISGKTYFVLDIDFKAIMGMKTE